MRLLDQMFDRGGESGSGLEVREGEEALRQPTSCQSCFLLCLEIIRFVRVVKQALLDRCAVQGCVVINKEQ